VPGNDTVEPMSKDNTMTVEVAYALPHKQTLLEIEVPVGTTVLEAAQQSGVAGKFAGVDLENAKFGIFGHVVAPKQVLQEGDRVEIYRPLIADPKEVREVTRNLADPLWASNCRGPGFERYFAKFEDGEVPSAAGQQAHHTLLLLSGRVRVERDSKLVDLEQFEGTLLCAISTLTGAESTVTLRADGPCWVCIFNEAELEQFISCNPSVAVRMLRSMATRIAAGEIRHSD